MHAAIMADEPLIRGAIFAFVLLAMSLGEILAKRRTPEHSSLPFAVRLLLPMAAVGAARVAAEGSWSGRLLNDRPNGLTLVHDEPSGWLAKLQQQEHAVDRAFYPECLTAMAATPTTALGAAPSP